MNENVNHFKVVGISHHLSSVDVREKFALSSKDVEIIHSHLGKYTSGGFVLSTCNRTEVYLIASNIDSLITSWAELAGASIDELNSSIYTYEGKRAIEYLFRVGTGLDSQILGDFQIIGQIKKAYIKAVEDGASNKKLTRLLDVLLRTSKRVKNETDLSNGVASMSYSAIQHAGKIISNDWTSQNALIYGAGKMGTAVVRKLAELMPTDQVNLANRTNDKAQQLAEKYQINNVSDLQIEKMVSRSSLIISTPAVPEPIFTTSSLKNLDVTDKLFIDLSMPRSIDPSIEKLGATVINLDYLKDIQNDTFNKRKAAIPQAEAIVKKELQEFYQWMKEHELSPTIHALKEKLNLIRDVEVKRLKKKNQSIDEDQINQIAEALINKVTTQCVKHVKKNNGSSLNLIQQIFEIEESK